MEDACSFAVRGGTRVAADRLGMPGSSAILALVILNLTLQVFDGVATYVGWQHFGEANPLLRAAFETWGAGPTLIVTKLIAVSLLFMLGRARQRLLVAAGLVFTFAAYAALSFVPWSIRLLGWVQHAQIGAPFGWS